MKKFSKNFFDTNEVLFIGYTNKEKSIAPFVYRALSRHGFKVYPMNNKADGKFEIKVYKDFSELPKIPKCAFVLLNKEKSANIINQLKDKGVKKVLFLKGTVDSATLKKCEELGIEAVVGCPLMVYGKGVHKLHGFLAGVR